MRGIEVDLLMYVPMDDPIKISRLKIRNTLAERATAFDHRVCRMGARHVARCERRRSF